MVRNQACSFAPVSEGGNVRAVDKRSALLAAFPAVVSMIALIAPPAVDLVWLQPIRRQSVPDE